jgi:serine/threonine protein kinase/Tfp pilus assembly protein PilF
LIGQTLSHYRVEKRLGAGGMGEVFLARDLALGRMAAVKVLSTALTPETRARMLREAEAAARLQHPAIATFFEAGESDGVAFLAMEFVEGETLRDRLRRGPLPFPQALSIAGALLEALGHAHAAGVLHRDIKPENVMVTADNLARLLDFGIARLQGTDGSASEESATEVALTQPGAVIGTLGYMSPEQLRGQPLDERSDLFSLGAVLFEMLEGRPAFPGATPAERIAAILGSEPRLSGDPGVPGEAASVLARALAREPERRYASAAAFLSDLRALASGELVAALPDSLAIVDLRNLSRVVDDDWIGSGFAESLASDLTRLSGVSLVPRQKVLQARAGGPDSESELGRKLGCRWVLSGAYQRIGRRLRVTALLMDAATGQAVFSEKLDGDLDEIFTLQDRLSALVAERLGAGGAPEARPAPRIDVYELHARGRRFFHRLEKGTLDQARELFELAAGADPSYAPALAGLAAVHAMRYPFQTDPRELEISESYARRAIAADPDLAEPRIWLGYTLSRMGRQEEGFAQESRAMELDPANAFAPYFAGFCQSQMGRREEALRLFQKAVELDPRHGFAWLALGWTHSDLGHDAEARWCLEKAVSLENQTASGPTAGVAGYLGEGLRRAGDLEKARAACLAGLEAVERSDNMYRDTFRAVCLCALGRTGLAQGDVTAARAAFLQAAAHLKGRPRTLGGGQLLVQALAGLTRAGDGTAPLTEALELFESRRGHNFDLMWACSDDVTLFELSRAAGKAGHPEQAADLLARAREKGSREALAADAP